MSLLLIAGAGLMAYGKIREGQIAEAQGKFAKQIAIRNQLKSMNYLSSFTQFCNNGRYGNACICEKLL